MVRIESVIHSPGNDAQPADLDHLPAATPTADFAAATIEETRRLFALLNDPTLEAIALLKLQNFTHEEIAKRLNCSPDTITRRLLIIRATWSN